MRINKFLSDAGYCSRREADVLIEQGRVRINERVAGLGDQAGDNDRVFVDGKEITKDQKDFVYIAYHKPVGVIVTTDARAKDNIVRKINYPTRIFPIGRLDVKSSGLILLTNDGEIVNTILKPENKIEKEYLVEVDKNISPGFLDRLRTGVEVDGRPTLPAKARKIDSKKFAITLTEGRNRQIRKMCGELGFTVTRLKRIRLGKMRVGELGLASGDYRKLSRKEIGNYLGV